MTCGTGGELRSGAPVGTRGFAGSGGGPLFFEARARFFFGEAALGLGLLRFRGRGFLGGVGGVSAMVVVSLATERCSGVPYNMLTVSQQITTIRVKV